MEFAINTDRPQKHSGKYDKLCEAIAKTALSGGSVSIPLKDAPVGLQQNTSGYIGARAMMRGLKVCTKKVDGLLFIWAEKKESTD